MPGSDLSPYALPKVDDTGPDGEPPTLVSETVFGGVEREGSNIVRAGAVANEATGGVRIQAQHEEERQVVGVPECFEALVADRVVCGGVHQHHDEEHKVA